MPSGAPADLNEKLLRRLARLEYSDVLDVEDRASLLDAFRREHPGPTRTENGVVFTSLADIRLISRHPAVVMGDPTGANYRDMGADHPLGPHSRDGADHQRFRELLNPVFGPRKVVAVEDQVRTLANSLIDGFAADRSVEFFSRYAVPLPCLMFLSLLGIPGDRLEELIALKDGIIHVGGATEHERRAAALDGGNRARAYLEPLLRERLANPADEHGLIDEILTANVRGDTLSIDEAVDVAQLFIIAGLDTVTSSLSCIVGWLAREPDALAAIVAEPALVPTAVEELLRFQSPVIAGERYATDDFDVNGFAVNAGERLHLIWGAANLDPEEFTEPCSVRLDRKPNPHIAFATGPHQCLGSHLARLELQVGLEEFIRRIPSFGIATSDEPRYHDVGVRAADHLPLAFDNRL